MKLLELRPFKNVEHCLVLCRGIGITVIRILESNGVSFDSDASVSLTCAAGVARGAHGDADDESGRVLRADGAAGVDRGTFGEVIAYHLQHPNAESVQEDTKLRLNQLFHIIGMNTTIRWVTIGLDLGC